MGKATKLKLLHTTAVCKNGGFSAFLETFVLVESSGIFSNFCAENPPLLQAAKRCVQHIFRTGEFNNLMQQMINFIFVVLWKNYAGD